MASKMWLKTETQIQVDIDQDMNTFSLTQKSFKSQ